MLGNLHVALLHWPMIDKVGDTIATATTNLDIHDIARVTRTYDVGRYWIVQPQQAQNAMIKRLVSHWTDGPGAAIHPDRPSALGQVDVVRDLTELQAELSGDVCWVVTTARAQPGAISVVDLASDLKLRPDTTFVLCFGTGWGMAPQVIAAADKVLEPIQAGRYNHLSVRSAMAIYIDRIWQARQGT